jgi:uncharacterized repeat protein (TIGR01451 family)
MRKSKAAGLIIGLVAAATLSFGLWPTKAAAAPPRGFTSTFAPAPSNTPAPPSHHQPNPTATPAPVLFDPIITKLVDVHQARVGDAVHYTLVITNPNSIAISNVVVVDMLPDVLDYLSASSPQGTVTVSGNTLTFNVGTLAAGQVLTIAIHTRVNSKGQPPNVFINSAHLTWDDGRSVDSNPVSVTVVPATLPATGEGPGLREVANMALAGAAALVLLGLGGGLIVRRFHRGH